MGLVAAPKIFGAEFRRFVAFLKLWRAIGAYGGVQNPLRVLLLFVVLAVALQAQPALENARGAQLLLGRDVWSRLIRVENKGPRGLYPRTVYALVFEMQGVLWFYTDANGTQSFSLHRDNLAAEKSDFGPLLRDIEPGFAHWEEVPEEEIAHVKPSAHLRNGCFIESLALWRARAARGEAVEEPRLLSFYFEAGALRGGHTVFAFREGDTVKLIDPVRPEAVTTVPLKLAQDPVGLARQLSGYVVTRARFLPLKPAPVAGLALS